MEEENKLVIDRETAKEASQKTVVSNESNERCKIHIGICGFIFKSPINMIWVHIYCSQLVTLS
jgi:hypothetical protein